MKPTDQLPNQYRAHHPLFGPPNPEHGQNGFFKIPFESYTLRVICSCGKGWDHVSVSLNNRTPNWKEMCFIKDLFFAKDEVCVQYHPAEADYVNFHPHCLHIWKPLKAKLPIPDPTLVGPHQKERSTITTE